MLRMPIKCVSPVALYITAMGRTTAQGRLRDVQQLVAGCVISYRTLIHCRNEASIYC